MSCSLSYFLKAFISPLSFRKKKKKKNFSKLFAKTMASLSQLLSFQMGFCLIIISVSPCHRFYLCDRFLWVGCFSQFLTEGLDFFFVCNYTSPKWVYQPTSLDCLLYYLSISEKVSSLSQWYETQKVLSKIGLALLSPFPTKS